MHTMKGNGVQSNTVYCTFVLHFILRVKTGGNIIIKPDLASTTTLLTLLHMSLGKLCEDMKNVNDAGMVKESLALFHI